MVDAIILLGAWSREEEEGEGETKEEFLSLIHASEPMLSSESPACRVCWSSRCKYLA